MDMRGLGKALRNLDEMKKRTSTRVVRKAVRAGMADTVKQAKRTAPKETGRLKRSITQVVKTERAADEVVSRVTAKNRGDFRGRNPIRYLHLVEEGTAPHQIAGPVRFGGRWAVNVRHPGTSGTHFLRRALEVTARTATANFSRKLREEIVAEARKLAK